MIQEHAYERDKFEDRDVLERLIFPYLLAYHNPKRVLDIGREDYQKFYNLFFKGRELWTIDRDPKRREFGARNHITADVTHLRKHFDEGYFDLIIMNGVFGWGLNEKKDIEKAFNSIHKILRKEGMLVFGWNDTPDLTPVPLNKIKALKKFKKFYFPPLKSQSFKCKTGEHTYNFYRR